MTINFDDIEREAVLRLICGDALMRRLNTETLTHLGALYGAGGSKVLRSAVERMLADMPPL